MWPWAGHGTTITSTSSSSSCLLKSLLSSSSQLLPILQYFSLSSIRVYVFGICRLRLGGTLWLYRSLIGLFCCKHICELSQYVMQLNIFLIKLILSGYIVCFQNNQSYVILSCEDNFFFFVLQKIVRSADDIS